MTIRTAIRCTLVASAMLALAGVVGVALVQAHAKAAQGSHTSSAPVSSQGPRDPANLADRLLLDQLLTIADPRAQRPMPRFVRQAETAQ